MKKINFFRNLLVGLTYLGLCFCSLVSNAQPGISEMNQATGSLRNTFFSARDATFVLAGLLGICGAVNIFYNIQIGKDKFTVKIASWFFAAFFVILMGPFLQALFGI